MMFKIIGYYENNEIKINIKLPSLIEARKLCERLKLYNYKIIVILDEN